LLWPDNFGAPEIPSDMMPGSEADLPSLDMLGEDQNEIGGELQSQWRDE